MHPPTLSLAARSPDLEDLIEKARAYIHAAKSPATLRAYRTDFEDFTRFCVEHDLPHLPASPTTVALYIADRASSLRSATITRRLTSITKAHQAAGFEASPSSSHHFVVSETLKGIRRSIGTAQEGKAPLLTNDIRRIVTGCPQDASRPPRPGLGSGWLRRRLPPLGACRDRPGPPLLHPGRPGH